MNKYIIFSYLGLFLATLGMAGTIFFFLLLVTPYGGVYNVLLMLSILTMVLGGELVQFCIKKL